MTGITVAGNANNLGNANNQLAKSSDVVLNYMNNLYVADYLNCRVQKYLHGASSGTTVTETRIAGSSPSQLQHTYRAIMDTNEDLYVADSSNHQIQFLLLTEIIIGFSSFMLASRVAQSQQV